MARLDDDDDEQLVRRAALLGDKAAFAVLVGRHESSLFYQLRRYGCEATVAEDLCQETFVRAWERRASFAGTGSFRGWLAKLAHNLFVSHLRSEGRRPLGRTTQIDEQPEPVAPSTASDVLPDLRRLLAAVNEEEGRLLVLSYGQGLTMNEIAEVTGQNPGTIKAQIHRAKEKIRARFSIEVSA